MTSRLPRERRAKRSKACSARRSEDLRVAPRIELPLTPSPPIHGPVDVVRKTIGPRPPRSQERQERKRRGASAWRSWPLGGLGASPSGGGSDSIRSVSHQQL